MDILVLGIIILLNVGAIFFTYQFIKKLPQKEKLVFIAICLAIHYVLVTLVYWISNAVNSLTANMAGQYTVYMLVPINVICTIPFLASSYFKLKKKKLAKNKFINRCMLMVVLGIVILIAEYFAFPIIQNTIAQILVKV